MMLGRLSFQPPLFYQKIVHDAGGAGARPRSGPGVLPEQHPPPYFNAR